MRSTRMPPNSVQSLKPRAENTGDTFAIAFGIVAVFLVLLCCVWGFLSGKCGRKHTRQTHAPFDGPISPRVSFNSTAPRFPSHPAVLRGFRGRPSREVQVYDPRTHTPFLNIPPTGEAISLPTITLARSSTTLGERDDHHAAFPSIMADRSKTPVGHRYSFPKTPGTLTEMADYGRFGRNYVCDQDSILTQPQPPVLEARSAGRAPPLSKQLDKFPLPRSLSASSHKLAHPNKLFKKLEKLENAAKFGEHLMPLPISTRKPEAPSSAPRGDIFQAPITGHTKTDVLNSF